jgi:murein DD-endopeptidase
MKFPVARTRQPTRGGSVDLALVAAVVAAVWLRTPVGGLAAGAWALATGGEAELVSLLATFDTGPPPEVAVAISEDYVLPILSPASSDGFPEPWRTAASLALPARLPAPARELTGAVPEDVDDVRLAVLDLLYDGDVEATLETYAVGEEQRTRAIARARAAGEPSATRFSGHRRYLPASEQRAADRVVSGTLSLSSALTLQWPVDGPHRITSGYGTRVHPTLGTKKHHNGVDLSVPVGTPVLAAQDGTVRTAAEDGVNGRYLVIDHGNGLKTSYCHLDRLDVDKGAEVTRGQLIAASGNTGRSTGPHLHFVVRIGRTTVDPERLRRPEDDPG